MNANKRGNSASKVPIGYCRFYWLEGHCKFGENCKFPHVQANNRFQNHNNAQGNRQVPQMHQQEPPTSHAMAQQPLIMNPLSTPQKYQNKIQASDQKNKTPRDRSPILQDLKSVQTTNNISNQNNKYNNPFLSGHHHPSQFNQHPSQTNQPQPNSQFQNSNSQSPVKPYPIQSHSRTPKSNTNKSKSPIRISPQQANYSNQTSVQNQPSPQTTKFQPNYPPNQQFIKPNFKESPLFHSPTTQNQGNNTKHSQQRPLSANSRQSNQQGPVLSMDSTPKKNNPIQNVMVFPPTKGTPSAISKEDISARQTDSMLNMSLDSVGSAGNRKTMNLELPWH